VRRDRLSNPGDGKIRLTNVVRVFDELSADIANRGDVGVEVDLFGQANPFSRRTIRRFKVLPRADTKISRYGTN
jgi:hypothetical protein